jgi:hypothetical protein
MFFQKGLNGILKYHDSAVLSRIDKWIVINEYAPSPKANWGKLVKQKYPFITFLQKGMHDRGQVKSLNHILPYITPYTYWFHWEEGWQPTRAFLNNAFHIMDTTNISQLQLTSLSHKPCKEDYCIVPHSQEIDENLGEQKIKTQTQMVRYWPLYSLQPSLNRVSFYTFGDFSEKQFKSPIMSEYDFAQRWYQNGGIKGMLKDGSLKRPNGYVSTHD